MEDEDLIVLGAQAETPAAGGDASQTAALPVDGHAAGDEGGSAAPGNGSAEAAAPAVPEGTKPDGQPEDQAPKPGKRTGIQRMQADIARLRAENEALRSAAPAAGGDRASAIEKEIGAAPKESDFTDFYEYQRALSQYDIRHALAEQRAADREASSSRSEKAAREAAIEAFQDRMDEARERLPDFDQVVGAAQGTPVAPHVTGLIVESEKSGLLTYYLAQNPAKLAELNGMTERQAAKAVGALEARLTVAKPKTATQAPAPARPVTGAAAPGPDPSKMDFAQYEAWRKGGTKR